MGLTSTIAGLKPTTTSDGVGAAARFNRPRGIAVNTTAGFALVADTDNHIIRRVELTGSGHGRSVPKYTVSTVAGQLLVRGSTDSCPPPCSTSAAAMAGASATFSQPYDVAIDPTASYALITDRSNHVLRRLILPDHPGAGAVTTVAGVAGWQGTADGTVGYHVSFKYPHGVAIDGARGFALVTDETNHCVRRVQLRAGPWTGGGSASGGVVLGVTTAAGGKGAAGAADGAARNARFSSPCGIALDSAAGFALVADAGNHAIRRLDLATFRVSTLAGTLRGAGFTDGTGAAARFHSPQGVAIGSGAELGARAWVTDHANHGALPLNAVCLLLACFVNPRSHANAFHSLLPCAASAVCAACAACSSRMQRCVASTLTRAPSPRSPGHAV